MNIRKPYYREFRRRFYETLGDKGDSILRYRGADNKEHYIASGNSPDVKPGGGMVETTWQELKDKRDAGKLIPGSLYRITDYQCTTTQENTRSAGHQFDIVLLALSENKLAEEGWAMMHENIYDVKFSDGRKKCYIAKDTYYSEDDEGEVRNIVDLETGLGVRAYVEYLEIDEENKEAHYPFNIVCLSVENLPYNYFQNSNLSAWKVWYCLDNDKSRFDWADDSVDEGSPASIECVIPDWDAASNVERWYRNPSSDIDNKYFWIGEGGSAIEIYTNSENPTVGASVYNNRYGEVGTVSSFTPAHEGTGPNGRGVIYRLIDEFNNDLPCDFKNILVIIRAVESYLITADDVHQDYSMLGKIRGITVSLCLHTDGHGNNKNAVPIGRIAPSSRTGLYNIKISSSALEGAGLLDISSNTIVGYTI